MKRQRILPLPFPMILFKGKRKFDIVRKLVFIPFNSIYNGIE